MSTQHVVGISTGKDSTAVACLAIEHVERRGGSRNDILFLFADTGNEDQIALDHRDYLAEALGVTIETVRADLSDRFQERRARLPDEWRKEKRRKKHSYQCKARQRAMRDGQMTFKEWRFRCRCRVTVLPPVSEERIAIALETLHPSGNPFLDLCMLKGRFPSRRAQFCTEELKVIPINQRLAPILASGTNIIQWMGERAEESDVRAKKPVIHRVRMPNTTAVKVFYRPVLRKSANDCFAIAERHQLKPNPLYKMNFSRVGCMLCVNAAKNEIAQCDARLPHNIVRIRGWEVTVAKCSRRGAATWFPAPMVPGDSEDETRAAIDKAVAWAKTSRGGRQYDLLQVGWRDQILREGAMCESAYGLCE